MSNYVGATENEGFGLKRDTNIRFMRLSKSSIILNLNEKKLA